MGTTTLRFQKPSCRCRITKSVNTLRLRPGWKMNGFIKSILTIGRLITRVTLLPRASYDHCAHKT